MSPLFLSASDLTAFVGTFAWPLARISGMLLIAPLFGNQMIPPRVRISVALLLTLAVMPAVGPMPAVDPMSGEALAIVFHQILIGACMGLVLQLVFAALVLAGEHISLSMGLGMAQMTDPTNGSSIPVIGQLLVIFGTLVFLALNGHLALIRMVAESFQSLPVSARGLLDHDIWSMLLWTSLMFEGALLVALPALTALLATNIAMGVVTRSAPQMNLFSIGLPVTTLVGMLVLWMSQAEIAQVLSMLLDEATRTGLGLVGAQ